jgi:hypothetical protein
MTIHASKELLFAMGGVGPWPIGIKASEWTGKVDGAPACGREGGSEVVYAAEFRDRWDGTGGREDRGVIDCPDCLRLVILARGERQDVIELREAAALTTRVNAELNAEKEKAA